MARVAPYSVQGRGESRAKLGVVVPDVVRFGASTEVGTAMGNIGDERLRRLEEPHVAPLTALVRSLQERGLSVPSIDPNDGGIDARVLFLLESRGPKAVGSTFISRDTTDPSARNIG